MSLNDQPRVSVITPVYNGEPYLAECIESVLFQTYKNWEYIIVNNCSTDKTLEIAQDYARKEPRIKVHTNRSFVGATENHNIAFHLISADSKYCKVVSADDWIYPDCITRLVEVAEKHPSIGIVGSYSISIEGVRWLGLPPGTSFIKGREACRLNLLGANVFGSPTSVLYRSELVRDEKPFFPWPSPCDDIHACYRALEHSDFGFVHQILSFDRVHEKAISGSLRKLNAFFVDRLEFLVYYGPTFLAPEEAEKRFSELMNIYYDYLAVGAVNFWGNNFWNYHKSRMKDMGIKFDYIKLSKATFGKLFDLLFNPKLTLEKAARRLKSL